MEGMRKNGRRKKEREFGYYWMSSDFKMLQLMYLISRHIPFCFISLPTLILVAMRKEEAFFVCLLAYFAPKIR